MTHVLLIDDCDEFRGQMRLHLQHMGYQVTEAADGDLGLMSYVSEPASIVLLDMYMPRKDGFETLTALLQHDPNARVIVMSGGGKHRDTTTLDAALMLGARKRLMKPVSAVELQTAIAETIVDMPNARHTPKV